MSDVHSEWLRSIEGRFADIADELERYGGEIDRLKAEHEAELQREFLLRLDVIKENERLRAELAAVRNGADEAHREIIRFRAELLAKDERISELYMAQKSKILSAKSIEYDIGTLQGENAKLKDLVRKLWEEVQADGTMASDHDAEIRAVLVCS